MTAASDILGVVVDPKYWVSGITYATGKTVRSPTDHQRYVRIVAGAGTTDPASDATNWRPDGGRSLKSIQRGVLALSGAGTSAAATITAVNTAKSELRLLGVKGGWSSSMIDFGHTLTLTNSTTITATREGAASGSGAIGWELTEWN